MKELDSALKQKSCGTIILIETLPENASNLSIQVIKELEKDKKNGIIILSSKPYASISQLLKNNSILEDRLFFIDLTTKSQQSEPEELDNVLYLEGSEDLTNISLSIAECIKMIEENPYVYLDSISSMLIHNSPQTFLQFLHGLLTKLRIKKVDGYLLLLKSNSDNDIRAEIAQLCDKVITI